MADSDEPDASFDDGSVRKIPVEADILLAYSVCPGICTFVGSAILIFVFFIGLGKMTIKI